jgi:outer membrane protein
LNIKTQFRFARILLVDLGLIIYTGALPLLAQSGDWDNSGSSSMQSHLGDLERSRSNCGIILTTKDASRCIGATRTAVPIHRLLNGHIYGLTELIDIAETSSPDGRIAWLEAKRSLERVGVDQALYLPLLTFAAQGGDTRIIFPFPKPIAPRGYVTVEEPLAQAQLELQYSLLDFSRKSRLEGSKALEIASTLQLSRVHQTIAYDTAIEFYRVQQASGQLEAAKTALQTAETVQQSTQAQFGNGRATLPDVQNAQAGAAEARYDLATAIAEMEKSKVTLTETIGVEPTANIEIAPQSAAAPAEPFEHSVEELIHIAWRSRPDLLAKAQEVRSAREAYTTAHASYMPSVSLKAAGGQTAIWATADFSQLGPADIPTWSVSANLRWDVFDGARRHEISSALAEQQAAAEQQRASQDAVTRQVWEAYVDYRTALEQERSAQSFLTSAQTSYDSSLDAFNYGVRSLVDVVQAERQLAQARLAAVNALAHRLQSEVGMSYATGTLLQSAQATGVHP